MLHFIWEFTDCIITRLGDSRIQRVNYKSKKEGKDQELALHLTQLGHHIGK